MMRAASLTQPWNGLVAAAIKGIENRSRPLISPKNFGQPIAVHATREIDESVYSRIAEIAPDVLSIKRDGGGTEIRVIPCFRDWYRLSRITSAITAVATPVKVIKATGFNPATDAFTYDPKDLEGLGDQRRWLFGRYGYVFVDVVALPTPVPCRGYQGFWTLPADVETAVRLQLIDIESRKGSTQLEQAIADRGGILP